MQPYVRCEVAEWPQMHFVSVTYVPSDSNREMRRLNYPVMRNRIGDLPYGP
jgi:hypothetical protein